MYEKKDRSTKFPKPAIFVYALFLILLLTPLATGTFTEGEFWSRIDNTLVVTNTTDNVNIGENGTTPYKLNVNGTSNFNGGMIIDGNLAVYKQLTLDDRLDDIIILRSHLANTVLQIPTPPVSGTYQIIFGLGSYTVLDTVNDATVGGEMNFFNPITYFNEKLVHSNDADTYIEFQNDNITFFSGGVNMVSLVELGVDQVVFNEDGLLNEFRVETNTHFEAFKVSNEPESVEMNIDCFAYENLSVTNNLTGNIHYGEMWFHNDTNPNVTVIPSQDIWYTITAFDNLENGYTVNRFTYSNNNLTCKFDGLYKVDYSLTISGNVNNKYHFAAGINGVQQFNTETHERMGTANDITSASGTGFLQLTERNLVSLMVMNEDGGNDVTVYSVNLNLIRIGD